MTPIEMLSLLVVGHALADYPLQSDILAKGKNTVNPLPDMNPWWILFMHSAIHGGFVGVITGSVLYGFMETVWHMIIDNWKCRGKTTFIEDQALHIMCKVMCVIMLHWYK